MFKPDLLSGQVVMVTGGGSGLGKAIASHVVAYGGRVALLGRRAALLDEAAAELGADKALPVVCDVRFADDVDKAVAKVLAQFGGIDALVNAAAGNFVSPTERLSPNAFKLIVDTVLMGTVHCTLAAGKYWIDAGRPGSVLNITANYASTGSGFVVPSACAKAGVEAMTRSLAAEWGRHGIRCLGISPGPFPTEGAMRQLRLHEDILPGTDVNEFITRRIPLGRLGRIEELADLAVFLLSPNAQYISGDIIRIDGAESPNLAGEFNFMQDVPGSYWSSEASKLDRRQAKKPVTE